MKITKTEFKEVLHDPGLYFIKHLHNWTKEDVLIQLEKLDSPVLSNQDMKIHGTAWWLPDPSRKSLYLSGKKADGSYFHLDITNKNISVEKFVIKDRSYYLVSILSALSTNTYLDIIVFGD